MSMGRFRFRAAVFAALAVFFAAAPASAVEPTADRLRPPDLRAEAAALIDVSSGRLLYERHGDRKLPIASLTKIMTAIVAIEHGRLTDQVRTGPAAVGVEGSSVYLRPGQTMSLNDLLYGLMLRSGNDAAVAIAEHVGGSVDGFVYLMNQKAEQLGLRDTRFRNPHGLDEEGHYSTAVDLARLTAYALHNPVFREIVKTKQKRVPNPNPDEPWDIIWQNKNKMLYFYEGADGVKTGYTKSAKRCLVSSATRDARQLVAVTLNDPDDWVDHRRLLDYGFAAFRPHTVIERGQPAGATGYVAAASFRYPIRPGEEKLFELVVETVPERSVAYRLGERGILEIRFAGVKVGAVALTESAAGPGDRESGSAVGRLTGTAGSSTFFGLWKAVWKSLLVGREGGKRGWSTGSGSS